MHPREISIFDLTYELPQERIAQRPLDERDASRLLVYRNGAMEDRHVHELAELLPTDCLLVLNNTRVVNARIVLHRDSGARIEILCLEPGDGRPVEQAFTEKGEAVWRCFIGNAKRWKQDEVLHLSHSSGMELRAMRMGSDLVRFQWQPQDIGFAAVLDKMGLVPLPPYMQREATEPDKERYNTVFARKDGSVAAPTASLHMTGRVLAGLAARGISTTELTLHVGAGTFLPVKSERMADHAMHREQVRVPLEAIQAVAAQLDAGAPVIPMGTTALRTLESLYWHGVSILEGTPGVEMDVDQWEPYGRTGLPATCEALKAVIEHVSAAGAGQCTGSTRLLIAPGYEFRIADALITNFHQPQSTLLLLVAAFIGDDWRRVYDHALGHGYRFLSYGDGSLLFRRT